MQRLPAAVGRAGGAVDAGAGNPGVLGEEGGGWGSLGVGGAALHCCRVHVLPCACLFVSSSNHCLHHPTPLWPQGMGRYWGEVRPINKQGHLLGHIKVGKGRGQR